MWNCSGPVENSFVTIALLLNLSVVKFFNAEVLKSEKNPFSARYEDGKLYYEGSLFSRRDRIIIENKDDTPVL